MPDAEPLFQKHPFGLLCVALRRGTDGMGIGDEGRGF
jgi:hypothetical protein